MQPQPVVRTNSHDSYFAPSNNRDHQVRRLTFAVAELQAQTEATQEAIAAMAEGLATLHERLEQIMASREADVNSAQTLASVQASIAELKAKVDRQQEPITRLAEVLGKFTAYTVGSVAIAVAIAIARMRHLKALADAA
jgi:predicted RNase H-like nuclease (RuvC/YqgF family)